MLFQEELGGLLIINKIILCFLRINLYRRLKTLIYRFLSVRALEREAEQRKYTKTEQNRSWRSTMADDDYNDMDMGWISLSIGFGVDFESDCWIVSILFVLFLVCRSYQLNEFVSLWSSIGFQLRVLILLLCCWIVEIRLT